jgi:uncharacterized protein YbjT (DUF2867 family)
MILITGATGNIGRELVNVLSDAGVEVRALIHDPAKAAALPAAVHGVVGDLGRPSTLEPAFAGVQKLFLLTQGTGTAMVVNALAFAGFASVKHIVLLSSVNAIGDPVPAMGRWHRKRERLLAESGIPATVLRPGGFMTNALEWAGTIRDGGYVFDPTGPGRFSLIDPADVAAVAALALLEDGHRGQVYVPTGDETRTLAEHVRILSDALGREIEVRTAATAEEAVRARYPQGAPPALAAALVEAAAALRADVVGFRTDDVERLLGRRPGTFAHWCARNADAFR